MIYVARLCVSIVRQAIVAADALALFVYGQAVPLSGAGDAPAFQKIGIFLAFDNVGRVAGRVAAAELHVGEVLACA